MKTVEIKTRYICHPTSNNGIVRATYKGWSRRLRYDQAVNSQANHYQAARRILDAVAGERFALVCRDLDGGRGWWAGYDMGAAWIEDNQPMAETGFYKYLESEYKSRAEITAWPWYQRYLMRELGINIQAAFVPAGQLKNARYVFDHFVRLRGMGLPTRTLADMFSDIIFIPFSAGTDHHTGRAKGTTADHIYLSDDIRRGGWLYCLPRPEFKKLVEEKTLSGQRYIFEIRAGKLWRKYSHIIGSTAVCDILPGGDLCLPE